MNKDRINFYLASKEVIDIKYVVLMVLIPLILVMVFTRIFIVGGFSAINDAERRLNDINSYIEIYKSKLEKYDGLDYDLEYDYAHYTFSGLNEYENSLIERSRVLDSEIMSLGVINSFELDGNTLKASIDVDDINNVIHVLNTSNDIREYHINYLKSDSDNIGVKIEVEIEFKGREVEGIDSVGADTTGGIKLE